MKNTKPMYHGHRFPSEIISHAVWLYHRFCLSFRNVEDLMAERGVEVSYESFRQWCNRFAPDYAHKLKKRRGHLGDIWCERVIIVNYVRERFPNGSRLRAYKGSEIGLFCLTFSRCLLT